ncbi:hypothetical protein V6N13_050485 [Hibiscus sabdariffa]
MLGTLDKVIPQDGSADSDSLTASDNSTIELLPGLDMIFKELLQEDGFKRFNWEHPLIKKVSGRLYDEYSNEFLDSIFAATLVVVSGYLSTCDLVFQFNVYAQNVIGLEDTL